MYATLDPRADAGRSAVECWAGPSASAHPLATAFEQYGPAIRRYLLKRTHNPDVADDLLSATFERAVRSFGDYEDRGWPLASWLYRIAHDRVIDHFRQQARRPNVPLEDWHPASCDPCAAAIRHMESEHVQRAIGQLRPKWRLVLTLRFLEDRALPDVAARLGLTVGAVKARQHRALVALREQLGAGADGGDRHPS